MINLNKENGDIEIPIIKAYKEVNDDNLFVEDKLDGIDDSNIVHISESKFQKALRNKSVELEDGLLYKAKLVAIEVTEIPFKNMEILNWVYEVIENNNKQIKAAFYFNDNEKCIETSLNNLEKKLALFNFKLSSEHLHNLYSLKDSLECLIGSVVEIVQSTRYDKSSDKEYKNYVVKKVLENANI